MVAQMNGHVKSHGPPYQVVITRDGTFAAFRMRDSELLAHAATLAECEQTVRNERPDARRLGIVRAIGEGGRL